MKYKIILVSGFAKAGKTTFTNLLLELNNCVMPLSFAYELKQNLKPLVWDMGIDIFRPTNRQKDIIRNLMIAYGCAWREINPNHWVELLDEKINKLPAHLIPVIDDARFLNEAEHFINKYGRENVLIVEIVRNGAPPPPKEELENQPKISAIADFKLVWETEPSLIQARELVRDFYNKYLNN
jgi:hypothetical protein